MVDKKDRLEQFVLENSEEFDFLKPDKGLWNKISEQTFSEEQEAKTKGINWTLVLNRAAVLIVVFTLSFFANRYVTIKQQKGQSNVAINRYDEFPELQEANVMFTSQFRDMLSQVKLYEKEYPELIDELMSEIKELDDEFTGLETDLDDNIANQDVIESMIKVYKIKLMILEDCLMEMDMESSNEQRNLSGNEKNMHI
ncbi:hypothetical protein OAO55_00710 [Bacteroidales bacterium]|nr:hypothetical protein [Bacteroidales bacterium]